MIDDFTERARVQQGLKKTSEGRWLCERCEQVEITDDQVLWCAPCDEIQKQEHERKVAREQYARWVQSVQRRCHSVIDRLPDWAHTKGERDFKAKVSEPSLLRLAQKWELRHGSILLLGPSGCGKTSAAIAAYRRMVSALVQQVIADPSNIEVESQLNHLSNAWWCTAAEIGRELSQHRLGSSEPEVIRRGAHASILFIDELGPEPARYAGDIFDLIDRRYAKRLPTVCTSGLTVAGFTERYGDAFFRRLSERGIGSLIDCHEGGPGG